MRPLHSWSRPPSWARRAETLHNLILSLVRQPVPWPPSFTSRAPPATDVATSRRQWRRRPRGQSFNSLEDGSATDHCRCPRCNAAGASRATIRGVSGESLFLVTFGFSAAQTVPPISGSAMHPTPGGYRTPREGNSDCDVSTIGTIGSSPLRSSSEDRPLHGKRHQPLGVRLSRRIFSHLRATSSRAIRSSGMGRVPVDRRLSGRDAHIIRGTHSGTSECSPDGSMGQSQGTS